MISYKRFLLVLATAALLGFALPASAFGAGPALTVSCGLPSSHEIVTCMLSGRGFRPGERVSITYRITYTALPRRRGHFPESVYHRTGFTDARGAFVRPSLRFAVVRYHEAYRLAIVVIGSSGDRAGTELVAIAQ